MPSPEVIAAALRRVVRLCERTACRRPFTGRPDKRFCTVTCRQRTDWDRRHAAALLQRERDASGLATCSLPGCDVTWKPHLYRADKRQCSRAHTSRASVLRNRTRTARKRSEYRKAATGRVCKYCKRSDAAIQFQTELVCTRCARQRKRRSCTRCGGPFYATPQNALGIVGCLVRSGLPVGFNCKDEV